MRTVVAGGNNFFQKALDVAKLGALKVRPPQFGWRENRVVPAHLGRSPYKFPFSPAQTLHLDTA